MIGLLDTEPSATRFSDALLVAGIENQVETEDDGRFSIWVHNEDQLGAAKNLLSQFQIDPQAAPFVGASASAEAQRREIEKTERNRRSTQADSARIGYERNFSGMAYLTLGFILLCAALSIYSDFGENRKALGPVMFTNYFSNDGLYYDLPSVTANGNIPTPEMISAKPFPEIRSGQLWRLLTPIFVHFGYLHLIFNMMLFRDLGSFIENRFGAPYLLSLVLIVGILSNIGQAIFGDGIYFGGMSGVDYGLFGFVWLRGKFDRAAGWQINQTTMTMLLVWFFACAFGLIDNIANWTHGVGLGVGMAWGFLSAKFANRA